MLDPIAWLYRHGPWPYFWQGAEPHEICASETQVGATHWIQHPHECAALIERKVTSWQGFWLILFVFVYSNLALCSFLCTYFVRRYLVEPVLGKKVEPPLKDQKNHGIHS